MAGLGLGPPDFALFGIDDPEQRIASLEAELVPKLVAMAEQCLPGLARVAGTALHLHAPKVTHRRGLPPEEALVALADTPRGIRGIPVLALVATRAHLHARVCVRGESSARAPMAAAIRREAGNLARKGKPFRKLRTYLDWNFEELPELAPAGSVAFWEELADALAPGAPGLDAGIAFPQEEARSLSVGDLLGVFRDLAPLYKVLANAAPDPTRD